MPGMSDPSERSSHHDAAGPAPADPGSPPGDSALVQRRWRRASTPAVIPLARTLAISQRIDRLAAGRLPLLERVQRWRMPVESAGAGPVGPLVQATRLGAPFGAAPSAPDTSGLPGADPSGSASLPDSFGPTPRVPGTVVQRTPPAPLPLGRVEPVTRSSEATAGRTASEPASPADATLPTVAAQTSSAPPTLPDVAGDVSASPIVHRQQAGPSGSSGAGEPVPPVAPDTASPGTVAPDSAMPVVQPDLPPTVQTPELGPPIVRRQRAGQSGTSASGLPVQSFTADAISGPAGRAEPTNAMQPHGGASDAHESQPPSAPPAVQATPARGSDDGPPAPGPGPLPLGNSTASIQRQTSTTRGPEARPPAEPSRAPATPAGPVGRLPVPGPSSWSSPSAEPAFAAPLPTAPVPTPRPVTISRTVVPTPTFSAPVLARTSMPVIRAVSARAEAARPASALVGTPVFPGRSPASSPPLAPAQSGRPAVTVARELGDETSQVTPTPSTPARSSGPDQSELDLAGSGQAKLPARSSQQPVPDLDDLADRVLRKLMRQLAVENERRGRLRWI